MRMKRRCGGLLAAAVLMLGACGWFEPIERRLIFRPVVEDWSGYSDGIVEHEAFWIPVGTAGERLQAWWVPAQGPTPPEKAPTLFYLHGARVNLTGSVYRIRGYARMGFNVLAIDYRGFGRSSERLPSEESVIEDALAAWRWLERREPQARKRVLYGHSLGGAIATELAAREGNAGALVLEATFTSIRDMAEQSPAGFLPLDSLLTQRFNVRERIAQVTVPVIILQGRSDSIVPADMAHALFQAARDPKWLLMVEGAGHRAVIRHVGEALRGTLWTLTCPGLSHEARSC